MYNKRIHIVAFDVPFPADYGGVIDVYSRLKLLKEKGWEVHLHCFEYGRGEQEDLESLIKVSYYRKGKIHH